MGTCSLNKKMVSAAEDYEMWLIHIHELPLQITNSGKPIQIHG
jgi:hypothetical protein